MEIFLVLQKSFDKILVFIILVSSHTHLPHNVIEECHNGYSTVWVAVLQFGEYFSREIFLALVCRYHRLDCVELCVVDEHRVLAADTPGASNNLRSRSGPRV